MSTVDDLKIQILTLILNSCDACTAFESCFPLFPVSKHKATQPCATISTVFSLHQNVPCSACGQKKKNMQSSIRNRGKDQRLSAKSADKAIHSVLLLLESNHPGELSCTFTLKLVLAKCRGWELTQPYLSKGSCTLDLPQFANR